MTKTQLALTDVGSPPATSPVCAVGNQIDLAARRETVREQKAELAKGLASGLLTPEFVAQVLVAHEKLDARLIEIVDEQVLLACPQCAHRSSCKPLLLWKRTTGPLPK